MSPKALILALVMGVATCSASAAWEAPWFCHDLDCPKFKLVQNMTDIGIEHRRYESGKWAATVVASSRYEKAVATGFWRLFKYISGANEDSKKIPMTAPVITRVVPAQGPFCEDSFTISFFVPFDFQDDTPAPTDETVFLQTLPAFDAYVASFSGYATGSIYLDKAREAVQALEDAGVELDTSYFYTAGYDSPFRLRNRHNEVWLLAAPAPSSSRNSKTEQGAAAAGLKLNEPAVVATL